MIGGGNSSSPSRYLGSHGFHSNNLRSSVYLARLLRHQSSANVIETRESFQRISEYMEQLRLLNEDESTLVNEMDGFFKHGSNTQCHLMTNIRNCAFRLFVIRRKMLKIAPSKNIAYDRNFCIFLSTRRALVQEALCRQEPVSEPMDQHMLQPSSAKALARAGGTDGISVPAENLHYMTPSQVAETRSAPPLPVPLPRPQRHVPRRRDPWAAASSIR